MSQNVFGRLIECVEQQGLALENRDKSRWIKRLSEHDANLMSKADVISTVKVTRQIKAVQIEYENFRYMAILGLPLIDSAPDGLILIDHTPGLFAIAVIGADVGPNATAYQIKQAIEYSHEGDPGFEGIDLAEISCLFPLIQVFQADKNYEFTAELVRVLGTLTASSYFDGPIGLDSSTLSETQALFEGGCEFVPFEAILQGLLSISWSGFFLELYRAIEQLYAVPKLLALATVWPVTGKYSDMAANLEKHLGWRPKENESLAGLIDCCSDATKISLGLAFCQNRENPMEAETIANCIYKLRNSLVHFRQALLTARLDDSDWNTKIRAMIALMNEVYQQHGSRFHSVGSSSSPLIATGTSRVPIQTEVETGKSLRTSLNQEAVQRSDLSSVACIWMLICRICKRIRMRTEELGKK